MCIRDRFDTTSTRGVTIVFEDTLRSENGKDEAHVRFRKNDDLDTNDKVRQICVYTCPSKYQRTIAQTLSSFLRSWQGFQDLSEVIVAKILLISEILRQQLKEFLKGKILIVGF
eukprot:TRINITY_DN8455_c0_g1_i2.p2 TRINITY_DN8455_c0_g1~~TRINITY_DN8455_c0_g1_i2.p2  ORF type:complete len:114 (-),score=2.76 TRINITY_DN8455_c0_g1_i2:11-352(-)